jgi:hypothetical protein
MNRTTKAKRRQRAEPADEIRIYAKGPFLRVLAAAVLAAVGGGSAAILLHYLL